MELTEGEREREREGGRERESRLYRDNSWKGEKMSDSRKCSKIECRAGVLKYKS